MNDKLQFRVEEEEEFWNDDETDMIWRYVCRYYTVNSIPDNWDSLDITEQSQYLWDNGSVEWYYDEDINDSDGTYKVLSVIRCDDGYDGMGGK